MAQLVVVRNSRIDEVAGFSAPINPNKYGTLPGHIMGGKDDIVSFTRWARDDVRDSEDYCGYENPLSQRVAYLLLMAEAYNAPVRVSRAEVSTDDPSVMDASNREKGKALGLSGRPLYRASKSREVCVRGRMRYTIKGEGTYEDGARLRNRFMSAMTGWSLAEVVLSDEGGKVCVQCDDSCATDMEGNGTVSILWAR